MRGGAAARLLHSKHQAQTSRGKEGIGFGVEWLVNQAFAAEKDERDASRTSAAARPRWRSAVSR